MDEDLFHYIRLGAQQSQGDDHHFLPGTLQQYDPIDGTAIVSLDIYRNAEGGGGDGGQVSFGDPAPPTTDLGAQTTQPSPLLGQATGDGTGIQCIPLPGVSTISGVLEGEEGYFAPLGTFWNPQMQTPAGVIAGSTGDSVSLDTTVTFPDQDNTSKPGDIIMRHPSGSLFRLTEKEIILQTADGTYIRIADGNIILRSMKSSFIQAGTGQANQSDGQIGLWATADIDIHAVGDFDVTSEKNANIQIQKDVLFTSAEGTMTLQTLADDLNINSGKNLAVQVSADMPVQVNNDLSFAVAQLTKFDGDSILVENTHQVYGTQGITNDILMYAPSWRAFGAQVATLAGTTTNIGAGTTVGDPVRAQAVNIVANKGFAAQDGASFNLINIHADGQASQLNMQSSKSVMTGENFAKIFGTHIVIGEDVIDPTDVPPGNSHCQSLILAGNVVNVAGNALNNQGHLTIQSTDADINITSKNLYAFTTELSSYQANTDMWVVGQGQLNLLGSNVDIGVNSDVHIPSPEFIEVGAAAPHLNEFAMYCDSGFFGGFGPGTPASKFTLKATETDVEVNGDNLHQVMVDTAMGVFNGHSHNVPTIGESDPPSQQMDGTCISVCLFTDAGTGGGLG